jgi:signal transduction histidine kinase
MTPDSQDRLRERIKELTALHQTARILQRAKESPREVVEQIVAILPAAWQYPSITEARIQFREWSATTPRFSATPWMQSAVIAVRGGQPGRIDLAYVEERPPCDDGPFLKEERELIDSLAEMLRSYFERVIADERLQEAHSLLEHQVKERTEALAGANEQLSRRVEEYAEAQARIERYQLQLRQLASQLAAVEARERRAIASDLHDHIGQALAFIRMNVAQLQGNAAFCGFEEQIADTMALLNKTIRYTRDLTSQISPPVLYELGLSAALQWLGDTFQLRHKVRVVVEGPATHRRLADAVGATVFKSVQELLTNVVKHAGAQSILVRLQISETGLCVEVRDDGCGFEVDAVRSAESLGDHFGLFSIQEQVRCLGGDTSIASSPGSGTRVALTLPC